MTFDPLQSAGGESGPWKTVLRVLLLAGALVAVQRLVLPRLGIGT